MDVARAVRRAGKGWGLSRGLLAALVLAGLSGCADRDRGYATPLPDARLSGIEKRWSTKGEAWFATEIDRFLEDYPKHPEANLHRARLLAEKTDPASRKRQLRSLERANAKDADPRVRLVAVGMLAEALDRDGQPTKADRVLAGLLRDGQEQGWNEATLERVRALERAVRFRRVRNDGDAAGRRAKLEALAAEAPTDGELSLGFADYLAETGDPAAALSVLNRWANNRAPEAAYFAFFAQVRRVSLLRRLGQTDEAARAEGEARRLGAMMGADTAQLDRILSQP